MRTTPARRAVVLTAAGLMAAMLAEAPAALGAGQPSSGPAAPVGNDGRRMSVPAAAETAKQSSSFEGTGALPPSPGPTIERAIPPVSSPLSRESVIAPDERVRITPTTSFPARAMTLITFSAGRCSGWMSGPDTVVTAGHCVSDGAGSFFPASSYTVYPGYDTSAPYGTCGVSKMITSFGFLDTGDERYDYGVLKLDCNVGLETGWMGFFTKPTTFDGAPAAINGYPGDKPNTQWKSKKTITFSGGLMLYYPNDTFGGMSGSPVYRVRPAGSTMCAGYCVMAVHTQGLHGSFPHGTYNHGVRITPDVYSILFVTLFPSFWA